MGYKRQEPDKSVVQIPDNDYKAIILGDDIVSAKLTVEWGERIGNATAASATSSQLRGIFTTVRAIESDWMPSFADDSEEAKRALRQFILLKSKLSYQKARDPNKMSDIVQVLVKGIDLVAEAKTRQSFQRFVDLFEAILAYHKVAGGKN